MKKQQIVPAYELMSLTKAAIFNTVLFKTYQRTKLNGDQLVTLITLAHLQQVEKKPAPTVKQIEAFYTYPDESQATTADVVVGQLAELGLVHHSGEGVVLTNKGVEALCDLHDTHEEAAATIFPGLHFLPYRLSLKKSEAGTAG
ncbi:hypothetical protein J7E24_07185 [Hymenobacter sp. ISL-91]|uniref:hypothetical protein n=1 Tax=Hymenobacter sp. ISL-91 TaxID=2819151 RepID=UPI001BE6B6A5|nr:hypothetical protein [Hymenobacter sp. ISL-91]MBT2557561.1 hypothetical protein [Hymenobacter sp. ISL-91]